MDRQRPAHQVRSGAQDGQAGQRMDMQAAVGRAVEAELHSPEGTAGVAGPDPLPHEAHPTGSLREEPYSPGIGRLQHQAIQRGEQYARGSRH